MGSVLGRSACARRQNRTLLAALIDKQAPSFGALWRRRVTSTEDVSGATKTESGSNYDNLLQTVVYNSRGNAN
jgi:hypothetical protein